MPGWGWRGGWRGPWPGNGPFSYLPPWLRPGWVFGRGACWWLFGYPWSARWWYWRYWGWPRWGWGWRWLWPYYAVNPATYTYYPPAWWVTYWGVPPY